MSDLSTYQKTLTKLYKFQEEYFNVAYIDIDVNNNYINVWIIKHNKKKLFSFRFKSQYSKKTRIWKYQELVNYINKLKTK